MFRHDAPMPDGSTVLLDRCSAPTSCGVWYDSRELPALHPRFYDDNVSRALFDAVRTSPAHSARSLPCPSCAEQATPANLVPINFVGTTLAVCDRCHGLWVDRQQVTLLLSALPIYVPGEGAAQMTHYRSAPSAQVMERGKVAFTRCVRCKAETPFADSLLTERGFSCIACASGMNDEPFAPEHQSFWNRLRALFSAPFTSESASRET